MQIRKKRSYSKYQHINLCYGSAVTELTILIIFEKNSCISSTQSFRHLWIKWNDIQQCALLMVTSRAFEINLVFNLELQFSKDKKNWRSCAARVCLFSLSVFFPILPNIQLISCEMQWFWGGTAATKDRIPLRYCTYGSIVTQLDDVM